jgi:hypothetical protein
MTLRSTAQSGRMPLHVEVARADELPEGVPAPSRQEPARDAAGRLLPSPGTTALASLAGRAAAEARQLGQLLGLWEPPEGHSYAPYARLAREWRDDHMRELASTVGGGEVGPGPASIVSTAAIQMGASRWLSDRGADLGDAKMLLDGSRLADSSRQNILAAFELAAREAEARTKAPHDLGAAVRDAARPRGAG